MRSEYANVRQTYDVNLVIPFFELFKLPQARINRNTIVPFLSLADSNTTTILIMIHLLDLIWPLGVERIHLGRNSKLRRLAIVTKYTVVLGLSHCVILSPAC